MEAYFKKIFDTIHTRGKGGRGKTADQMETVGGSCDCAFSSGSLDTALGLGSDPADSHIKWLKLQGSPWGSTVKATGACPVRSAQPLHQLLGCWKLMTHRCFPSRALPLVNRHCLSRKWLGSYAFPTAPNNGWLILGYKIMAFCLNLSHSCGTLQAFPWDHQSISFPCSVSSAALPVPLLPERFHLNKTLTKQSPFSGSASRKPILKQTPW